MVQLVEAESVHCLAILSVCECNLGMKTKQKHFRPIAAGFGPTPKELPLLTFIYPFVHAYTRACEKGAPGTN